MSVTAPAGFVAAGVASGIKSEGILDLALVAATKPALGAAVFTVNRAAAAPVILSRSHLAAGPRVRAVVLNSGCANAGTGYKGMANARETASAVAEVLGCATEEVQICSTGGIGMPLPLSRVLDGIADAVPLLAGDAEAATRAARAIMTTDTVPKESTFRGQEFTVGGMAKGAGMVRPDMATMLAVLTTDAAVEADALDRVLRHAVDESFHALNIDGCPSTNDTVILLASGRSDFSPDEADLEEAVKAVCRDLAYQLAADAEGAGRVVTIEVVGMTDDATARRVGRLVADSALVRAAFFGGDPNWGRLMAALGAAEIEFDPSGFGVSYEGIAVAAGGIEVDHDRTALHDSIAHGNFTVTMTVGDGPGSATVLTTDLTPDYVNFNAEYS